MLMGSLPEADRISSLPDCILESIVSLLPIREAGRTCIFSKRWRYVWASAPSLNMTDDTGKIKFSKDLNWSFIGEQALSLHNGPILDFQLYTRAGQCDLDQWIPLLTRKGLQKLKLNFHRELKKGVNGIILMSYRMHTSLFSCSSLVSLDLTFCSLNPSCDYKGLPSLKNLTLAVVRLNDSILESLVSGSGRLEKLRLLGCDGLSHLKIHASNLLFLDVECKFNAINLSKSSNLKQIILFQCERDNAFASMSSKVLEGLPLGLMVLFSHDSFMQYFFGADVPVRLSTTYNNLRYFSLSLNTSKIMEVKGFVCLLRSFPYLEYLAIQVSYHRQLESQSDRCFWETMICQSGSWLSHLRGVQITLGEIRSEDMELIKFLLLSTTVLYKFFIETSKGMDQAKQLSLEKQLLSLPKASSRAKIILKNSS
ncbi:F-box/FBD/LRR-repeat protein At1g13570-like [Amborella trichopoda]|uniref:F-box/FBD/LRR-repeat protein At1g13570-like n=1 Tax=Amborella trichopoda TaxID=13333 RepID=UPI0009BF4ED6|nr:F-box/FBD/LRR-repeat protein At1g13570-like [Amborella trichopoda]|eukprot:XP_020527248.1 F-box/FBD/LRR-repeat protein At1g13570-like [Amborella trichopoda]